MNPRVAVGLRWALTLLAVLGLAYDAYVHFDLASNYDAIKTSTVSQGDLFRSEGVIAILVALALLVRPRRYTALLAFLVAGSALAVLLIYRYYRVKAIGPIPSMYEPVWFAEKTRTAYAEGVATVSAAALLLLLHVHSRARDARAVPAG
ncbi:MAG: hypothetical protein ACR2LX_16335 [Jatrophihabitans sp.]